MPFTFIWPRGGRAQVDLERLAARLCPYRGEVAQVDAAGGRLYASSLAALAPGRVTIPAGTARNPQTAWLEITTSAAGARLETDPLGTFPLWLAEDDGFTAVTAEVKSLRALAGFDVGFAPERWPVDRKRPPDYSPYARVRRAPPGAVVHVAPDGAIRIEPRAPLVYHPAAPLASPDAQRDELDAALRASADAIAGAGAGEAWAALLSGGIDSATATALVHARRAIGRAFTLGTEHGDEYADAEDVAGALGVPHARVFATTGDARAHFERAVIRNETIDGLTGETLAQLSVLIDAAAGAGAAHVVTGYGADLLFGSMLRHELYMKVTGVDDLQALIERTCWSGELAPFYAWSRGVTVHHLFWDPRVMNTAFRVPPGASFDGVHEKIVLRELAVARGYLARAHAYRRKQALTDGTQFGRVLSAALGLDGPYAYDGKNAAAAAILRGALA